MSFIHFYTDKINTITYKEKSLRYGEYRILQIPCKILMTVFVAFSIIHSFKI